MTDSRNRLVLRAALASSALMLLWLARPLLLGRVPVAGDLLRANYPFRDFYAHAIATGQRFDWMPMLLGGFDFTGISQNGGYHPLHYLLYRFLPLDAAFAMEVLLPYPLAFAGMWLFLRRWCDSAAAAAGAMLFTFSGFSLLHGLHTNISMIFAHVPWLLWCIHGTMAAGAWRMRLRWCAAIAALTGSQLLLDHPQAVWLSGLVELLYLAFLLARPLTPVRRWGFAAVGAGKLLGLTVGAIQVMATLHAAGHSTRAGADAEFAFMHSMPLAHLLQLLNPYLLWGRVWRWTDLAPADEFAVYGGAVTLLLVVWWAVRLPALRARGELTAADRFGVWAVGLAVLGLWLATGRTGGLYYVETLLPIVNKFRVPLRFILFTDVALACAAAVALVRLVRVTPGAAGLRAAVTAAWVVAGLSTISTGIYVLLMHTDTATGEGLAAVALGPLTFAVAAAVLTMASRGSRLALAALVLVAAADQTVYGFVGMTTWQALDTRAQIVGDLGARGLPPLDGTDRISCCPFPNAYELAGYRVMEGYVALAPVRQLRYGSPAALRVAQVRYVHKDVLRRSRVTEATPISDEWYSLPPPLPRARLVNEIRVSAHPDEDIDTLDVEHAALVTHNLPVSPGPPGTAAITRDEPGLIYVRADAPVQELLVVSEMYEDRWTVDIDGRPALVERVNGDFLGCVVPAGRHEIHLEFHPRYREIGAPISLGGVGLVAVIVALGWWPRRSRPVAGDETLASERP